MTVHRTNLLYPVLLALAFASPAMAEQKGTGPSGVTVGDLADRGFVCKPFGDGMLHCTNPDNGVPSWVCYPNEQCTPGKPRLLGSGRFDATTPGVNTLMRR